MRILWLVVVACAVATARIAAAEQRGVIDDPDG